MSAGEVREAARLMRERAQATDAAPEGAAHWFAPSIFVASGFEKYDAVHIASWPPAVALAVADLLDILVAGYAEYDPDGSGESEMEIVSAWADNLARAYLGETS